MITFPFRVTRVEYLGADRLVYGVIEGRTPEAHVISKIPTNIRAEIGAGQSYDFVVAQARRRAFRPRQWTPRRQRGRPVTAVTVTSAGLRRKSGLLGRFADDERWLTRALLAPAIIYIVLLVGLPFLLSLYYSLTNVTIASREMHFVGLENFQRIIESRTFWLSLKNTLIITVVSQFCILVLANVLAMALLVNFRGKWLVRLLILLPWVAPISLGSIGWLWIFNSIYSDHQLDRARDRHPRSQPVADLARRSDAGHGFDHHPQRVAAPAAGDRDHPGRIDVDPAGHPRRGGGRRRRLLAASLPDHHAAGLADHAGGAAVRHHLHLHRHDRGVRADARRALRHRPR